MIEIVVKLRIEGTHRWNDALEKCPEVGFLSTTHRHIFHISARRQVDHDDRDVEIILFKRAIENHLVRQFGNPCQFQSRSCEMIAEQILQKFKCTQVEVLEDGENGAIITK